MIQTIYNILVSIVGNPNVFANFGNAPELVQYATMFLYIASCFFPVIVVSFVFKFLLKMVER